MGRCVTIWAASPLQVCSTGLVFKETRKLTDLLPGVSALRNPLYLLPSCRSCWFTWVFKRKLKLLRMGTLCLRPSLGKCPRRGRLRAQEKARRLQPRGEASDQQQSQGDACLPWLTFEIYRVRNQGSALGGQEEERGAQTSRAVIVLKDITHHTRLLAGTLSQVEFQVCPMSSTSAWLWVDHSLVLFPKWSWGPQQPARQWPANKQSHGNSSGLCVHWPVSSKKSTWNWKQTSTMPKFSFKNSSSRLLTHIMTFHILCVLQRESPLFHCFPTVREEFLKTQQVHFLE